jgi:spore maturation protein CgeB|uniref:glycosyltransferase family protein n=1 Tax=Roseburia faecis TaxID=301302 RepID=UPI004025B51C
MNILFLDWPCFGRTDFLNFFSERHDSVTLFSHADYELRKSDSFLAALYSVLENQQFDFCFSYNFFPLMATACHKCNIKYISFVYDSPQVKLYSYTVTYPTNYIFLFDSSLVTQFQKEGLSRFYYMPLPVNADRIHSLLQKPYDSARLSADVSFVGSLYNENHNLYDSLQGISSYTKGYLDAIMQAQSHVYGYNFLEECLTPAITAELQNAVHYQKNPDGVESLSFIFSDYYLCRKLTSMERINILTDVASHFPLKIFTPNNNYVIPNASNMGVADYLTETPYIFHDSKINLNITLRSIKSGIPLRCMEIMSCGGFLLTNFQSDFFKHFVAGEDFVYFESNDDMLQKIDYYLTHEKERTSIAESGYQKVIKNHSYETIFQQIFNIIG